MPTRETNMEFMDRIMNFCPYGAWCRPSSSKH